MQAISEGGPAPCLTRGETERETDRQTDRDGQTDRRTDRWLGPEVTGDTSHQ